ncbi:MAG: dTMP kinase [Armatimonadota bacterium]
MSSPSDPAISCHPLFIVLEGVDGSGKTTQAQLLAAWFRDHGFPVVLTREPGGTPLGERLREILLNQAIACAPRAELLMMLAARAQHVAEVIRPALQAGSIVISDRFSLSSLAYQGWGRGLPVEEIRAADATARDGMQPDVTFLVDVSLPTLLARIGDRQDRFEGEGRLFLQRVIDGYRQLAGDDAMIHIVDGTGTIDEVQCAIRRELQTVIKLPAEGDGI